MMMMMMTSSPSETMKKNLPAERLALLPCFYFLELPLVATSLLSLYLLEMTDLLQPARGAFRCFDRQLSLPYVDGGDELVPMLMLLSLVFSGPAASIMLVEGSVYFLQLKGGQNVAGCSFNSFLRRTVRFVGVHLFGLCFTALLTDVIQMWTGYHAPFFLTVCKPNYTLAGSACDRDRYVTRDICSGTDQQAIMAARKTFPSQHATLSAYAAVYISMYFNATISDRTKLLKPLLVFAFAVAAAMSGLTQITQHRSHPVDVYVGFIIGAFVAAYLALHAVSNFRWCEDSAPPSPPLAPPPDALRALTERGHQSVYHKGPASASESHDDITEATATTMTSSGTGPLHREADSSGSLKRASVDVELLAPRSPMGKETMLTFSNTLPRVGDNDATATATRRLKAVQPLTDPEQLMSEWRPRSTTPREDLLDSDESPRAPLYPLPVAVCGKPVATPRPPQIPDAPPPVSPKSALTRAKWMAIREKANAANIANSANAATQPRLLQIVAMTKQLSPPAVTEASSPTTALSPPLVAAHAPPLPRENPWENAYGSFRPAPPTQQLSDAHRRDHHRKTATLVLLDRDNPGDNPYRRYKD